MATLQEYRYHTKAVAAYGTFRRPFAREIPALAAVRLEGVGQGYESKREGPYNVEEVFRFEAAYTQVAANEGPENVYNSLVTATVEKLNIADMITADVVTARLTSEYNANDYENFKGPWVSPIGSSFVNLRIAGRPYEAKLPPGFTFNMRSPASYQTYRKRRLEARDEPAVSTLDSGVLRIPGFGVITLARLAIVQHPDPEIKTRIHRLTMLLLELGSPIDARMSIGEVESDGGGWP